MVLKKYEHRRLTYGIEGIQNAQKIVFAVNVTESRMSGSLLDWISARSNFLNHGIDDGSLAIRTSESAIIFSMQLDSLEIRLTPIPGSRIIFIFPSGEDFMLFGPIGSSNFRLRENGNSLLPDAESANVAEKIANGYSEAILKLGWTRLHVQPPRAVGDSISVDIRDKMGSQVGSIKFEMRNASWGRQLCVSFYDETVLKKGFALSRDARGFEVISD